MKSSQQVVVPVLIENWCATCHLFYAFNEKGIITFKNGKSAHKGSCTRIYLEKHPNVSIADNEAYAMGGVVYMQQPLSDRVAALNPA
ncbi:MAG: hypothetical protein JW740_02815 [Candidatus Zambryskibacteria bacterium]|nr:hypothetical protein [Candidatus Zambryskibacteria bacterium]